MANLRLMKQFINILDTQQLYDLHDILADDFYFKSPDIEISGKQNYIEYVRESGSVFTTDQVKLYEQAENIYVHEYIATMIDSQVKLNDQIYVIDHVKIKDGLIASSTIDYKLTDISDLARDLLNITFKNHGNSIKN